MKIRNLVLALSTAALLPTLAYADNGTDATRASFDRIFDHGVAAKDAPAAKVDDDNDADEFRASFDLMLDHEVAAKDAPTAKMDADPLVDAIVDALTPPSVTKATKTPLTPLYNKGACSPIS